MAAGLGCALCVRPAAAGTPALSLRTLSSPRATVNGISQDWEAPSPGAASAASFNSRLIFLADGPTAAGTFVDPSLRFFLPGREPAILSFHFGAARLAEIRLGIEF